MSRPLAAALALALGACSGEEPPKPAPAAAPAAAAPAPAAVPAGSPMPQGDPTAPSISLSVNGAVAPVLFRGWPARAIAVLDPPAAGTKIELEGPWAWSAVPGGWALTGEQTAAIAAGKHRLRARSGPLSVEIDVEVRDEPAELTPEQKAEKRRRAGEELLRAGKAEAALELGRGAEDVDGALLEGDALAALGRPAEARTAWVKALQRHREAFPKSKPPLPILRRLAP